MRKVSYLLSLMALMLSVQAWALDASISLATFYSPQQNYVEINMHLSGRSLTFVQQPDSSWQAAVEVVLIFKQGEQIVKYDKFRLNSPSSQRRIDFVDLKRYSLANGTYDLEFAITDANNPTDTREYKAKLNINYLPEGLQQSDISLLASVTKASAEGMFTKNGVDMEPLPYQFYGRGTNSLYFYHEVYHADQTITGYFGVTYTIERLNGSQAEVVLTGNKAFKAASIVPVMQTIDISQLSSGNYRLRLKVIDRNTQVLSQKTIDFQRSNPLMDMQELQKNLANVDVSDQFVANMDGEELKYNLLAIQPHLPQRDIEVVNLMLRYDSLRAQRLYLYSFWAREKPSDPKGAFDSYMEVARAVDKQFNSGFRYGFETDRGYVYMKYGQPSDIVRQENEPSAPPYEIWSYNEVKRTNQNNVRFIFYNPSLAADDFILLHSDVTGERNNPQWQMQLYRSAPGDHPDDYFQGTDVMDNMGRRARQTLTDW